MNFNFIKNIRNWVSSLRNQPQSTAAVHEDSDVSDDHQDAEEAPVLRNRRDELRGLEAGDNRLDRDQGHAVVASGPSTSRKRAGDAPSEPADVSSRKQPRRQPNVAVEPNDELVEPIGDIENRARQFEPIVVDLTGDEDLEEGDEEEGGHDELEEDEVVELDEEEVEEEEQEEEEEDDVAQNGGNEQNDEEDEEEEEDDDDVVVLNPAVHPVQVAPPPRRVANRQPEREVIVLAPMPQDVVHHKVRHVFPTRGSYPRVSAYGVHKESGRVLFHMEWEGGPKGRKGWYHPDELTHPNCAKAILDYQNWVCKSTSDGDSSGWTVARIFHHTVSADGALTYFVGFAEPRHHAVWRRDVDHKEMPMNKVQRNYDSRHGL